MDLTLPFTAYPSTIEEDGDKRANDNRANDREGSDNDGDLANDDDESDSGSDYESDDSEFESIKPIGEVFVDTWVCEEDPSLSGFNLDGTVALRNNRYPHLKKKKLGHFWNQNGVPELKLKLGGEFGSERGPPIHRTNKKAFITSNSDVAGLLLIWLYRKIKSVGSIVGSLVGNVEMLSKRVAELQSSVNSLQNVNEEKTVLRQRVRDLTVEKNAMTKLAASRARGWNPFSQDDAMAPPFQLDIQKKRQRSSTNDASTLPPSTAWDNMPMKVGPSKLPPEGATFSSSGPSILLRPKSKPLLQLEHHKIQEMPPNDMGVIGNLITQAIHDGNKDKAKAEMNKLRLEFTKFENLVKSKFEGVE
ncbi:hypothetical protein HDU79_011119 [Rhizoclosmatium sp. JEL0117]|nr:hypothetical protein HDU79_011119 [Rhizoclosmatium sp. JEL0117]